MTNTEELLPWKMFSAYVRGVKAPIESAMARRPGIDFNIVPTPLRGYPYAQWNFPTSATTAEAEIIPLVCADMGGTSVEKVTQDYDWLL